MDVAALNVKVTFQVNETVTDRYGKIISMKQRFRRRIWNGKVVKI